MQAFAGRRRASRILPEDTCYAEAHTMRLCCCQSSPRGLAAQGWHISTRFECRSLIPLFSMTRGASWHAGACRMIRMCFLSMQHALREG
mmetsp:Transcript_14313/g.44002  ORF Transcript_14313/g.44002 Transcript_14313/m.44002 type:complete len:89 (+) Transcript_14313:924-1190(+)